MLASTTRCIAILLAVFPAVAWGREWKDSTGQYSVEGTLFAFDSHAVIIKVDKKEKPNSPDLLSLPIEKLSEADRDFLASKEADAARKDSEGVQTWIMKDGLSVVGRVVNYGRRDVTIQRRRGKVYVNERPISNLPEIYRKMIPKIVEHFDQVNLPDQKAFDEWMLQQKAMPRTFKCEGIILEFENGDEYGIPFFFLSERDLKILQPGWKQWLEYADDHDNQERESAYLRSQAMAHQLDQQRSQKMAMIQLELTAVAAGVVDLWEVYLEPGVRGSYPLAVVVPARDSQQASVIAMQKNPGYIAGPVRKIAGR